MPHVHPPYHAFDLDCVREIIRIVRARAVRDELKLFAKCVTILVEAALGATIGEPDTVEPLIGAASVDDELLAECKAALEDAQGQTQSFGADEAEAIDPLVVAMLVELAVKLITAWLEKRRT